MDERSHQGIKRIKTEINEILAQDIQKKLMYMKQRYYEAGSKSTKLLAYGLKKQMSLNSVYKIRDSTTKVPKYKTEEIQKCFETYYRNLYTLPKIENRQQMHTWVNSLYLPRATEEQNSALTKDSSKKR